MKKIIILLFSLLFLYSCINHKYSKQDLIDISIKSLKNKNPELIKKCIVNKDFLIKFKYPVLSFKELNDNEKREINEFEKHYQNNEVIDEFKQQINEFESNHKINWNKIKFNGFRDDDLHNQIIVYVKYKNYGFRYFINYCGNNEIGYKIEEIPSINDFINGLNAWVNGVNEDKKYMIEYTIPFDPGDE